MKILESLRRHVDRSTTARQALHSAIRATKMREPTVRIYKAEIVAALRSRGLLARADWVDQELPLIVDTYENAALLRMLDIDPAAMTPADARSQPG